MLSKYFLKYPVLISVFVATSSFAIVKFDGNKKATYNEPLLYEVNAYQYVTDPLDIDPITLIPEQGVEEPEQHAGLPRSVEMVVKPINYKSENYKYDLSLITEALFHEARGDDYKKVFAVIMNRLHHRLFGSTIHSVIHKPSHFSYLTDFSYSELRAMERYEYDKYKEIRKWVHEQFSSGTYVDDTGGSLYYYAYNKMDEPYWWDAQYATVETDGHRFATWHLVK